MKELLIGLIGAVIYQALASFVKGIVVPWYRSLVYNGIKLYPSWICKHTITNGCTQENIFTFTQSADKLKCTIDIKQISPDGVTNYTKKYIGQGLIKNRIVMLQAENAEPSQVGYNSFQLEIVNGGHILKGTKSWFSVSENIIKATDIELSRIN